MFFRNWFYLYLNPTRAETVFEACIAKLGQPYRAQYPFPGLHRIVDFAMPEAKVVIEVDGASHEAPAQRRKDLVSTIALEKAGWRVIRFTNAEVLVDGFVLSGETIERRLASRPTLPELEAALSTLLLEHPELCKPRPKTRKRPRAPGPKSARKRHGAQDKT